MNNTNQQLYAIYNNIQRFYSYRKLVSLDKELSQDQFIKLIQKHKCLVLSSIDRALVTSPAGEINDALLHEFKNSFLQRIMYPEKFDDTNAIKRMIHNEFPSMTVVMSGESKTVVVPANADSNIDSDSDAEEISRAAMLTKDVKVTNILLVYPGTECETKRANMAKFIGRVRFPKSEVFIITPIKISTGVTKALSAWTTVKAHRYHKFRAFTYTLLSSVIPEHHLAPSYRILSGTEIAKLQAWFSEPDSLPKIFESDPQMVWIGAQVDDVVAFTYPSEITIEAIRYCKVIPNV
jgi:DNA-directed RNA polymerase subunit H (RpoH/RPB5)